MKPLLYGILFLFLTIVSCTSQEESIPYQLQPDGLKKKIEVEVIANSKEEVITNMKKTHELYSTTFIWSCWDPHVELVIKRNNAEQLMIRKEIIGSKHEIQDGIFLYYTANADLTSTEVSEKIKDPSYEYYSYPFHSRISKEKIDSKVRENQELLQMAKEEEDPNLSEFYERALFEWQKKYQAVHALGVDELVEIQNGTFIQIEDIACKKGLSPLTEESIKGLLHLRNYAAEKYFHVSYYELYFNATRYNDLEAQEQVNAINHLYPMLISDESYARANGLLTKRNRLWLCEEATEILDY